jgi:PTS system fructose-specific IIC component
VIPSMMLGGATTGAIVAASGIELRAPHGGIFVFFAISNFLLFLLAVAIGAVVGGVAVTVLKGIGRTDAEDAPEDAVDLQHAHAPVGVPASATSA